MRLMTRVFLLIFFTIAFYFSFPSNLLKGIEIIASKMVEGVYGKQAVVLYFVPSESAGGWKYVQEKLRTKRLPNFKDIKMDEPVLPANVLAAIYRNAYHDVIGGYKDGTFKPDKDITRAEFISIAVRAFDADYNKTLEEIDRNELPLRRFKDIEDHWAEINIALAVKRHWVKGYSDGTFRPEETITHAEALVILDRIAHDFGNEYTDPFSSKEEGKNYIYSFGEIYKISSQGGEPVDEKTPNFQEKRANEYADKFKEIWNWAYPAIRNFEHEGIIGYKFIVDREFYPSYKLTRAETAVLVDAINCHFEKQRLQQKRVFSTIKEYK